MFKKMNSLWNCVLEGSRGRQLSYRSTHASLIRCQHNTILPTLLGPARLITAVCRTSQGPRSHQSYFTLFKSSAEDICAAVIRFLSRNDSTGGLHPRNKDRMAVYGNRGISAIGPHHTESRVDRRQVWKEASSLGMPGKAINM